MSFITKTGYLVSIMTGLSCLAIMPTTAGTMGSINPEYIIGVSAGPAWTGGGTTQMILSSPETIRTYSATSSGDVIAAGELFLGIQREIPQKLLKNHPLLAQIGLELATTSHAEISGDIWDDANPAFNNFTYSYQVIHTRIAVKGKLLTELKHKIQPFVSASLGAGFNQSLHFDSSPIIFDALPISGFSSRINSAFTYTIGTGVQWTFHPNWQAGIGYEFSDWGSLQLSPAPAQSLGAALAESHYHTNALLFSINYLA